MPTGNMLIDGFVCKYTFQSFPNVELWMRETTPPGFDMGGKIDVTTQENIKYRTAEPKKLITVSGAAFVAGFDPAFLTRLSTGAPAGMLGKKDLITCTFADGSKHNFWGWLEAFKPNG